MLPSVHSPKARIMMLFGVCNFLHAVSYYAIGTTISELRGFWIMWSLPGSRSTTWTRHNISTNDLSKLMHF